MNIHVNDFDGPLDLLWHLLKANKMDIYDIDIEVITKEYLNYINEKKELTIDIASEYLVMASELIHLKSKLLLNNKDEEEDILYEINNEEELRNRLLEYEKIKNVAGKFKLLEEKRNEVFTKIPENLKIYQDENHMITNDISLDDLVKAFEEMLKRKKLSEPINTTVTQKELSVEERCKSIKDFIKSKGKCNFLDLFETFDKPYVIVTFLSILNLAKSGEIRLSQDKNFSDILIEDGV